MDNNSNGKLIALAIGGAVIMGALFFGVSFLTGYQLPAENFSPVLTPLKSFMGWFLLIFCASLIIWGLGRMSSRISDRWFLSFPLSIFVIVAVMFVSLEVVWEKGRTTTVDGKYIRTVRQLDAFNEGEDFENIEDQPVEEVVEAAAPAPAEDVLVAGPEAAPGAEAATAPAVEEGAVVEAPAEAAPVTVALSGDALAEAEKTFQRRCTRCHAIVAVENKLAEYRKKGQTEKIVLEMKAVPNSGIRKKDVPVIVDYINASY
ncbi:MAG: photosystem P840 reaction-center cytochrome c-551 [Prosthecochloris sp.]|uniref:Photosystem P840 reaction center cytochrome c-551 n=1 Tax=Prosthecochloris aestuarii (strain DSM 271 / SK 413) TaxID=290512 RepID=B4S5H2_PROA2|nr:MULTISPECIES: photosystem P840 reaction-center cytochrome c-551 [Prosthecochloris]ACF45569.1 photosystem P840 reaction center cytochrome c-551 [Prosthecochloris aestuarii DSM 271]MCW8798033.1 photosystem P840 reaction-center cytochrome c-551 [Prosthecochloris sp.]